MSPNASGARDVRRESREALIVWIVFFAFTILVNGTIPFILGVDMHAWTYSVAKGALLFSVNYVGLFVVVPLWLTKGGRIMRRPGFLLPLIAAGVSIFLWYVIPYIAVVAILVILYLHRRFDLAHLGFRSKGWKGDGIAILIMGLLGLVVGFLSPAPYGIALLPALGTTAYRAFANPASTMENLFYFGFITERLGNRYRAWGVPFLVGAMYTAHEVSNPEYWYEGQSFAFIFVGIAVFAAVYLWRRNTVVVWTGDWLNWFFRFLVT